MKAKIFHMIFVCFVGLFLVVSSDPSQLESEGPLFSMSSLDSGIQKIINCGQEPFLQIGLTASGSIIKSKNNGFIWESLDSEFINRGKEKVDFHPNEIGDIRDIIESSFNLSTLYFIGTKGINWLTTDCAKTLRAFNHGRKLEDLLFHPINDRWILATAFTSEEDEVNSIYKELFLSKDGGVTWKFVIDFVVQVSWGLGSTENIKFGVPRERILVTTHQDTNKAESIDKAKESVDFVYSDDFFISRKLCITNIESFSLTNERLFIKKKEYFASNNLKPEEIESLKVYQNVWYADTKQLSYDFSPIFTNLEANNEYGNFQFIGMKDSVMMFASEFPQSKHGDLFINDIRGGVFTSSLSNVVASNGHPEFTNIKGIDGTLFANVYEIKSQTQTDTSTDTIVTKISFNQGISWHKLLPPQLNSLGKPYKDCITRHCYLHLHNFNSNNDFLANKGGIGIIVTNGNVGEYLDHSKASLFLSRDGGVSWKEVTERSHLFNVGEYGSITVFSPKEQLVTDISYSIDDGNTFNSVAISSIPIRVDKIVNIENSLNFIVYGSDLTMHSHHESGMIVGLNFTRAFHRKCLFPEFAGSVNSDYELWTPHGDYNSNKKIVGFDCLLGIKVTYVRRKENRNCYNGIDFKPKSTTEKCKCQVTDYVCDFGYDRESYIMPCQKKYEPSEETLRRVHGLTDEDGCRKIISKGYRKIAGNMCIGGLDLEPKIIECEEKVGKRLLIKIAICFGLCILLIIMIIRLKSSSNDDNAREIKKSEEMFNISQLTAMNRSAYDEYTSIEGKSRSKKPIRSKNNESINTSINDDSD